MEPKILHANASDEYFTEERCQILELSNSLDDVGANDVVIIPAVATRRITNTGETDLIFLAICTPRFLPERDEQLEK